MTPTRIVLGLTAALLLAAAPAHAQDVWTWNKGIASGRTLEIKGVNGHVKAVAVSGGEARVTARKSARRGNTAEVTIEVVEHAGGVTICAVYPTPPRSRQQNECRPGSGGPMNVQNNDVQVNFEVQVPAGVAFIGRSVNGGVEATGMSAAVEGHSVNGAVTIETVGVARAKTVNGAINVSMGRSDWRDRLEFETVNGGITVTFTGDVNTEVTASTVNGGIETDYPLQVMGRFGPRRVSGTIGSGGRELVLSTVNGGIAIRRR
jgi:hypothetical protein